MVLNWHLICWDQCNPSPTNRVLCYAPKYQKKVQGMFSFVHKGVLVNGYGFVYNNPQNLRSQKVIPLKILLCDNDPFFLSLEREKISAILTEGQLEASVACAASSAAEALTFLKNNPDTGLAFLDLDFGSGLPNGIDVAALLRQQAPNIRIVFTTNHYELAMDVLKSGIQPYGFLEKGTDMDQLAAGLQRYIRMALRPGHKAEGQQDEIRLTVGAGQTAVLRLSDILYVEAEKAISHGITYHTANGSHVTILSTLDAESARLGEGFLRVHRSYLVAKQQILALRGGFLVLSGQQEIPCAFRKRAEVKKWLEQK